MNAQKKEKGKWNMKKCCPLALFSVTASIQAALMGLYIPRDPGLGVNNCPPEVPQGGHQKRIQNWAGVQGADFSCCC